MLPQVLEAVSIQQVLDLTGEFATVTAQVMNASKSHVWTTSADHAGSLEGMHLLEDKVPSTKGGRLLGAHVAYAENARNVLSKKLVSRGIIVAERLH